MAAADTARLVAELTLDAKGFQKGVATANKSIGKLEGTIGKVGQRAGEGLRSFGRNVGLIGVAAAGGIALAVKTGLQDLATLESAITSVDGAVAQLGLTGQLTGDQVAAMANKIERDVGAAFDDKAITEAAATLLRFGKVTPKNLEQALVVMTDLAAKTGDVESASSLLAKALADPTKAAAKLARQGIILSKAQQDTIKAMVEQNDIAGAQKVILDELAKTTGGAALASQGKYQRALSVLNDVAEDARKALAEGFLPVIEKVANKLSTALADPKIMASIREFGVGLAGSLDSLISIAEKLPWATIGQSLQIAGAGAKAVLQAFTSLPPWIQTAVITGWGLNKLTGGALTSIVGTLASGLIKGVLGINAGVVNINAATVNGGGGLGGPASVAGGIGVAAAGAAGIGAAIAGALQLGAREGIKEITKSNAAAQAQQAVGGGPTNILGPLDRLFRALQGDFRSDLQVVQDLEREQLAQQKVGTTKAGELAARQVRTNDRLEAIRAQQATSASALIRASTGETAAIARAAQQQVAAQAKTTHAAQQSAAAIRDKRFSVTNNITIPLKVTVSDQVKQTLRYKNLHNTPV